MRKINLQMFAYDPNSIVDYLKSTGQDSSYSARKELAKSLGITNYNGSGDQNTQMLNALKNGSSGSSGKTSSGSGSSGGSSSGKTSGSSSGSSARPKGAPADAPSVSSSNAPSGSYSNYYTKEDPYVVPSSNKNVETSTKEITPFTQSGESKNASQNAKDKLAALDKFDVDNIISQETWDAINTPFNASTAYQDAMNMTNQLREQLTSGKTSYTDQIKNLLNEIQNRDKFSYDLSNDTLFQQSLASAMASGKTAMQDTIGQASALTGGYGSTYATSAANQTYNSFIEDAYNNLPEYYQMALQAYEMEGNEMYKELSALSDADATEYQRLYDSYNVNFQNAQTMYQNEYTAWQDSVNTAIKNAGLQVDEFSTLYEQAYKTYTANQSYADSLYANELEKWKAEEGLEFDYANLAQNQSQHEDDVKYKYDALAQDKATHESDLKYKYDALAQDNAQHKADLGYKYSALAQDDAQHKASLAQDQKQFEASQAAKKEAENSTEPTKKQREEALAAYEEGGVDGLKKHLNSYGYDAEEYANFYNDLTDYALGYGVYKDPTGEPVVEVSLKDRTWTKLSEDKVKDQYGNEFKLKDLPEDLAGELKFLSVGKSYKK